jgi:hypothetical protein
MKRKNLIVPAALLALCFCGVAAAQNNLGALKSWAGKYPTDRKGRVTKKFFGLPEIRTPLLRLLNHEDFGLLTNEYAVEAPIKLVGDYLAVKVCKPHDCADEQAGFAINLNTGVMYVRMQAEEDVRWFASKGKATNLPKEVQDEIGDFGTP